MEHIPDWPLLWKQLVEVKAKAIQEKQEAKPEDAWAGRACAFGDRVKKRWQKEDSSRKFLVGLLKDNPGCSVLDIGAGTGSWACLLAPYAAKVTALEPSPAMRAVMAENIRDLGIKNIEILQDSWPEALVEDHDFTLCSHAMYNCADFPAFVRRMDEITRRCCILLMRAPLPDGVMAEIARELWGQPHDSPNFHIGYNILLQMGIFANVLMEDTDLWKAWSNTSIEAALADVKGKLGLIADATHDAVISRILQRRLVWSNGIFVWPSEVCSVLVYWFKQQ